MQPCFQRLADKGNVMDVESLIVQVLKYSFRTSQMYTEQNASSSISFAHIELLYPITRMMTVTMVEGRRFQCSSAMTQVLLAQFLLLVVGNIAKITF
jgi:hypothetical protein